MQTNYKITVPKPCHEDWNQMTPDHTGRFCNSCAKSVVDFSDMKAAEIQEYFIKNRGLKVCGRFKNEQLDSIIIQIPKEVLFTQVQFHKMFLLALLISMGTTLFSCQDANGDKQKIDGVEVVESETITMGIPLKQKTIEEEQLTGDTVYTPDKTTKTTKTASGKIIAPIIPTTTGIVSVEPHNPTPTVVDKDFIYHLSTVEVKPDYPGGIVKFYDYFKSNFKVPEKYKDTTGKLILSFVVDKDGSLTDVKIPRGINSVIDNEVLKFIKASPKWIPGEVKGEKVKVSYAIPIKITPQ